MQILDPGICITRGYLIEKKRYNNLAKEMQTSGERICITQGCMHVNRGCGKMVKEMRILDAGICTIQSGFLRKRDARKRSKFKENGTVSRGADYCIKRNARIWSEKCNFNKYKSLTQGLVT